jgi:hypothetical protein
VARTRLENASKPDPQGRTTLQKKRDTGRPKMTWRRTVEKMLMEMKLTWRRAGQNRIADKYGRFVLQPERKLK